MGIMALGLFGWAGVSFLTTVVVAIDVQVQPHTAPAPPAELLALGQAPLPAGRRIQVIATPPSAAFTIHHLGKPNTDHGRQVFRVQTDTGVSHTVGATFGWRGGESPFTDGFIEAALYYQIHCNGFVEETDITVAAAHGVTINELGVGAGLDGDIHLCFSPATNVMLLSGQVRVVELMPNGAALNRHNLYLIASITNAGMNIPPGQQHEVGNLSFFLIAR